ncbi:hypothetical protein FMM05_04645 [Flavobacterium zepuense]|uniref:Uncharacterized protein n=1 Tax=Flavobacterium zepuense TaxID=2593302 RepID=A0A552V874_9FLAO|nr:hypothetical protein [Flavobacterium zepuense]TRW26671.1 hypothetical protein FMM05_04645 [Flavobacterium zepuense]
MKYRFTPQQLDKISRGIELSPSEEAGGMTFIPLDEEYTTNGGGYSGTVININGTCYTWHSVKDGWVACPGCECPTPLEVPSGGSNYGTFTLYSFSGFGDGGGTTGSPTGGPFNPTPPGSTIGTPPTVIPGVPYPTPGNDYGIITNPGHSIDNSDDAVIGFIQPHKCRICTFCK